MLITRSSIAVLILAAGSSLAIAQTAAPTTPATPAATTAPAASPPTAAAPAVQLDANQNNPVWVKFRAACKADIAKHCGDVERVKGERGKMRACLDTHKAELTADCSSAIVARDAAVAAKKS